MTHDNQGERGQRAGVGSEPDPKPLRPGTVVLLMLAWTASMAVWFVSAGAGGSLSTTAVALAVGGLIGVVWLLGLLVLGLFLFTSND